MAAARVIGNADMPLDVVATTPVGTVPSKMADEGCSSSSMASTHDIEKPEVQHVSLDPVTVGPNVRPVSMLFGSMRWHDPSQAPQPPEWPDHEIQRHTALYLVMFCVDSMC